MANKCKDCRFYEPKHCAVFKTENLSGTTSACHNFAAYSSRNPSELKHCMDCRFFDGNRCSVYSINNHSPHNSACEYGSIIK